jgi:hypothetical protein
MGCFRTRTIIVPPISQNVRKRDSAVGAALGFFSEGRLRPVGRSHCAWLTCLCSSRGERCEGGNTFAATFRNRLEDGLQDALFGSTEHAEVNGGRLVHRLFNHRGISADARSVQLCGLVRGMKACRPRLARALYRSSS